tara:strand:+ start:227 stop:805 length:579 start_codon:yes stop_codon:yes gene_type:complete
MAPKPASLRRIVTGHNEQGRSCIVYDSSAPNVYQRPDNPNTHFNELWTLESAPSPLSGNKDYGAADREYSHSPPSYGAHFRIVQSLPDGDTFATQEQEQKSFNEMNSSGASELKIDGPARHFHRTPSVDYAFNLGCDRYLILDDSETVMRRGDVVIQLANYHAWVNKSDEMGCMAFDMIGGEYPRDDETGDE